MLEHRLILAPDAQLRGVTADDVVRDDPRVGPGAGRDRRLRPRRGHLGPATEPRRRARATLTRRGWSLPAPRSAWSSAASCSARVEMLVLGIAALVLVLARSRCGCGSRPAPELAVEPAGATRPPARRLRGPHRPRWSRTSARAPLPCSPPPTGSTRAGARRGSSCRRSRAGATRRAPRTASRPAGAAATGSARSRCRSPTRSASPGAASRRGRGRARRAPPRPRDRRAGRGRQPDQRRARGDVSARGRERPRRRVPHPARVRDRRRPAPRALALDRPHRRAHDPPGRGPLAFARRGGARRARPARTIAESFEVAVEAAASVTARLVRLRRRVEVVTSAGELLGTGGDPRHDVIDRSPPSAPTTATAARRCSRTCARTGASTSSSRSSAGSRPTRCTRSARSRASAWSSCSPDRPRSPADRSRRWSSTRRPRRSRPRGTRPSPARARSRRACTARMARRARFVAPFALAALSVGRRALARRASSTPAASCCRCSARPSLPHALGALVRRRGWPVVDQACARRWSASRSTWCSRSSRRPPRSGFPSGDTWRALDRQLTGGWHLLRTAPAPAPATDGAILLAVLAVWCMAAIADWLAFGRQATLAAISPALVFFVWTSTLGTERLAAAAHRRRSASPPARSSSPQNLAVLDRRRSWLVSQHAARPHVARRPAALLGGAAVVVRARRRAGAPGCGRRSAARRRQRRTRRLGGHSYRPSLPPLVDVGDKLDDVDDVELFTVRAPPARLLAHRRARRVLRRQRRSVDAERRGRATACRSACPATAPGGAIAAALRHRPARRALDARRVRAGGDRPRRHARGDARPTPSSPTRRA